MPRMYFGHPINTYGTPLETFLLERIKSYFPGWDIVNPSDPVHQAACKLQIAKTGNAMDYFLKLASTCDGGTFLPFRDEAWGAGIWGEASVIQQAGHWNFKITPSGDITLAWIDLVQKLTVEETRARIRTSTGETIPY